MAQNGGSWLDVLAKTEADEQNAADDKRKQMIEYYVKSRQWAQDAQEAQRKQEHEDLQRSIEIQRERRMAQEAADTRRRSDRDYAANYVQREREMIYKNIEIMKGLNQAYWAAVKAEGKSAVDTRMSQAQALNAATVQALQAYQGNYQNQQIGGETDGLLTADQGFYASAPWKSIQTQLKNDPVLIEQVKRNVVNYAKLPAEARQAELANYVHDLQLSRASTSLTQGARSPEEAQAKLEAQTHYLLQQLPAMPPPDGSGQAGGQTPPGGGPPAGGPMPPAPKANIPRGAFGGHMTVTDEDGKKRTYMVPTEDANGEVREAMDMYNTSPKAQEGQEFDEWFGAKQAFNDFLNSPYDDYFGKDVDAPKAPRPKGLQHVPEHPISAGPF